MFNIVGIGIAALGVVLLGVYHRLIRPWQLRWGATDGEVTRAMAGDEVVKQPTFHATRAVTIQARPEEIWPWLVQIGVTRAGWYSYDWLDNLGKPSARRILPQFQHVAVGDVIPMSPDGKQGMGVKDFELNQWMLWWDNKGDATWVWGLYPQDDSQTRLITRVRMHYRWLSPAILFSLLVEFTDIAMMRKCMLGIKRRAEHASSRIPEPCGTTGHSQSRADEPVPVATSPSATKGLSARIAHRMQHMLHVFTRATRPIRTVTKAAIFFLKVFPMLPSRPVDWVTKTPVIEKVRYPTRTGQAEGDLYRSRACGPHPGIVVCLGVVPFGVDHPQVPILGKALARAGFVALLYWSSAMRDFRLDPDDVENIALAYRWLLERPDVDPARSGLLGTCVGGSFALMAAASPLIRDRVAFLAAYAPYCSMWTFAEDIASATRSSGDGREPWQVDPLTRKVFVHSLIALLEPGEAEQFRSAFSNVGMHLDGSMLSADGQAMYALLTAPDADEAETALHR
ncbi:MAG TPA: hypothetical protein VIY29_08545, partial [Ktedonobacteraceae bacterium]